MSNILIIKHGSLGDIAQASGAIQDIYEHHKNDQIHLLTTKAYFDLFKKVKNTKNDFEKLSTRFKELRSLAIKYKEDKDLEIGKLKNEIDDFKMIVEKSKNSYEEILDKTTKSIEKFIEILQSNHSDISILINNAGITQDNIVVSMKEKEWMDVINIHLNGTFTISKKP